MRDDPREPSVEIEIDRPLPAYYRVTKSSGAVTVLGAAMLAVGEILEPEKATVEIVQADDDSLDDDRYDLEFGDLPTLD